MTCVYCQIKDLTLYSKSFFITGLIIAKTEKKIFKSQQNVSSGGVMTITVRDTKDHYINCKVWGSEYFIDNCDNAHKCGDVISIYQASLTQKSDNSTFHPRTTSPFELAVKEGRAYIHRATEQSDGLLELQHQAVKPTSLALRLSDLDLNPDIEYLSVDLLVLVQSVEPVRQIQAKSGESRAMRKVYLMDTTMESMSMTVWNSEYHGRMDQWVALQTILHLVDVRAEYSAFERTTVLTVTSKTIITENPIHSSRSSELMAHIHSLSVDKLESLKSHQSGASLDVQSIKEVLNVKRILDQIERDATKEVATIVYGVITKFDINAAVIKTCIHCRRFSSRILDGCGNSNCESIQSNMPRYIDKLYMAVSVTDHSGTLNCRINDEYGKNILGYTAPELKQLSEDEIDAVYNRFILERFAVKVIVKPKSNNEYSASILSIEKMDSDTVAMELKL